MGARDPIPWAITCCQCAHQQGSWSRAHILSFCGANVEGTTSYIWAFALLGDGLKLVLSYVTSCLAIDWRWFSFSKPVTKNASWLNSGGYWLLLNANCPQPQDRTNQPLTATSRISLVGSFLHQVAVPWVGSTMRMLLLENLILLKQDWLMQRTVKEMSTTSPAVLGYFIVWANIYVMWY